MFKYLRMDAYRLIKTKTLYVALGIILAAVAFSVWLISSGYSMGSVVGQLENATRRCCLYFLLSYIMIWSPTSASMASNGVASWVVYMYSPR